MSLRPKHIYNRLNRARLDSTSLELRRIEILKLYGNLREAHAVWMAGNSPARLAALSQNFIDLLSDVFLVSRKTLQLTDRARPHGRDQKGRVSHELHGICTFQGNIRIYLRTAARKQPIALKTFFNTLIHEWVHHYDFEALGDTIHCAGFYQRTDTIYKCCVQSTDEAWKAQNQ